MTGFVHPAPYPLRTERLTLTDLVDSDFAAMHVMDSDENVMRYIGGAQTRSFDDYYALITQRLSLWIGERFHMGRGRQEEDRRRRLRSRNRHRPGAEPRSVRQDLRTRRGRA